MISSLYTVCFFAFLVSSLISFLMIKFPIYDIPNERSSHQSITPRGAGLGILLSFMGIWFLKGFAGFPFYNSYFYWILCLGISTFIGILGFLDDILTLKDSLKLVSQIVLVAFLGMFGICYTTLPLPILGEIPLGNFGMILTVLWFVGFINTFNFMDGINGITAFMTIIASFFWYLISSQASLDVFSFSALILIFASGGFLIFNFPKAFIFMGDVGSLFIGSLFALWSVLSTLPQFGHMSIWIFPMLFFLYLYDVIYTRIRRILKGHPFLSAHREHLFQLLNRTGWTQAQVVLLYGVFFCLQGMAAYGMQFLHPTFHLYLFIPFMGVYGFLTYKVLKRSRDAGIDV